MRDIVQRFCVGIVASAATVGITLTNVNEWLKFAGAIGSVLVIILTAISWMQKIRRDARFEMEADRDEARYDRREASFDRRSAREDRQSAKEDRQEAKDARA